MNNLANKILPEDFKLTLGRFPRASLTRATLDPVMKNGFQQDLLRAFIKNTSLSQLE